MTENSAFSAPPPPPASSEIGIVTAFYDLGRGDWSAENGHPAHLLRTTDTYFERFSVLAALDNELVVYTSPDLVERVWAMRRGKEDRTVVVPYPIADAFAERRTVVKRIQSSPEFKALINPTQICNPEYWSVDYIIVTNLKTLFTAHAVQNNLVHTPLVAWVDFGLARNRNALQGKTRWEYPFAPDKAHLFFFSPYNNELSIPQVTANNVAYVHGGLIVAPRALWPRIAGLAGQSIGLLTQHNLVDDDQTVMLMVYLAQKDLFEIHLIGENDWGRMLDIYHV